MDFPVTILRPNCPAIFAAAVGGGVISNAQAWSLVQGNAALSQSKVMGSVPTAGNLLVVCGFGQGAANTLSISDDMTDGGVWAAAVGPVSEVTISGQAYIWWKVVGASANTNKTITLTSSSGTNVFIELFSAEFTKTSGTFSLDGTPVSATGANTTNPTAGSITTTQQGLIVGHVMESVHQATAGSGYTVESSTNFFNSDNVEDQFTSAGGIYSVNEVDAGLSSWIALGAAWKAS